MAALVLPPEEAKLGVQELALELTRAGAKAVVGLAIYFCLSSSQGCCDIGIKIPKYVSLE